MSGRGEREFGRPVMFITKRGKKKGSDQAIYRERENFSYKERKNRLS